MILPYDDFTKLFDTYGFSITEKQYADFNLYAKMLVEYNKNVNLTAITDPQGISEKHFLDSVLMLKFADIKEHSSIIDVGTGAGFPAIPLKIYRNDLDCTLLDSLNKRVKFLQDVSNSLSLDMKCIHSRAEDGGQKLNLREKFDIATARAVAAMPLLSEFCLPYVKVGGTFYALKGPNEDYKIANDTIKLLGGEISDIFEYSLPNGDMRMLIAIKKIKATPLRFPRSSAMIKKGPIC